MQGEWSDQKGSYRTKSQARLIAAIGWLVGGVIALMGLGIHDRHGHALAGVSIAFAVGGVAFIAMSTKASRACAIVTSAGLIVRNPIRTIRTPWDAIERVSLGPSGVYATVGRVHLHDGGVVRIWGIQGRKRTGDIAAERLIAALDEWRTKLDKA